MKKKDTIIFDLDGTLLDTLEDLMDAVNFGLSSEQLPLRQYKEIRTFVGNGIRNLIDRSVPDNTPTEVTDRVFEEFKKYYKIHCKDKTRPYSGIKDLLQELSQDGYKMAIVSNKADAAVQELLKEHFYPMIMHAFGEKDNIPRKPAPDIVYMAVKQLKSSIDNCLYVGDSEVDFKTAENAKMKPLMVSWGFRDRYLLEELGAELIADTADELLEIIKNLIFE